MAVLLPSALPMPTAVSGPEVDCRCEDEAACACGLARRSERWGCVWTVSRKEGQYHMHMLTMHVSAWHCVLQGVGFIEIARCRSGSDDILDDADRVRREAEMKKGRIQGVPPLCGNSSGGDRGGQASWC